MITNDYIKGYIMALETLDSTLNEWIKEEWNNDEICNSYNNVQLYIEQQKNNYKQLVKELNEAQSKKTRS